MLPLKTIIAGENFFGIIVKRKIKTNQYEILWSDSLEQIPTLHEINIIEKNYFDKICKPNDILYSYNKNKFIITAEQSLVFHNEAMENIRKNMEKYLK